MLEVVVQQCTISEYAYLWILLIIQLHKHCKSPSVSLIANVVQQRSWLVLYTNKPQTLRE